MKNKAICILALLIAILPSCSKLKSGESFNQVIAGVEYNFEVIVSRMSYVRLTPVSGPAAVRGHIVLPSVAEYDGDTYVVTQIGARAFMDYTEITAVTLPKTLSTIEKEAFAGCVSLAEINTPQPLSVIGDYAFDGCVSLSSFSLKASISQLGTGVFRGCSLLGALEFTPTFSAIPDELCMGCSSLVDVVLPSTVMTVGAYAFADCVSVQSISIDRSLQSIGDQAFAGCVNVGSIVCLTATPPISTASSFAGISPVIPVTVPMASVTNYKAATGWSKFTNIKGTYR